MKFSEICHLKVSCVSIEIKLLRRIDLIIHKKCLRTSSQLLYLRHNQNHSKYKAVRQLLTWEKYNTTICGLEVTGPSSPLAYRSDQRGGSSESEKGTWSLLGIKFRNDRKGNKAPPTTSPLDPCMEYGVSSIRCSLGINSHERKDEVTGLARGKKWTVVQAWQCPGQPSREPRGVTYLSE